MAAIGYPKAEPDGDRVKYSLDRLIAMVGEFLSWWLGGLAALVPSGARRAFRRSAGTLVLDLSGPDIVLRHHAGKTSREIGRVR